MDKTIVKAFSLVEALAASETPRGLTDLAAELDMTKSNVHRLLGTLIALGYARQPPGAKTYQLTTKIWELGLLVHARLDLVDVARPVLRDLAAAVGETVHLSILDGRDVVYLDKIDSRHPIAAYTRIGGRAPAHCVATGKAMLAFGDRATLSGAPLARHTEHTITAAADLAADLDRIREAGYAVNRGEWREGVWGIACPILGARTDVLGSIGVSGPADRFEAATLARWPDMVRGAAEDVSRRMGFPAAAVPRPAATN